MPIHPCAICGCFLVTVAERGRCDGSYGHMVENCHCPALPGESLLMPELGDVGYWGLYEGGGRKLSLLGPCLGWARLRGLCRVFYINFLGRISSSFPLCSLPSFPISAPPCLGWRQEGERDGGWREEGFHPLVSGVKAFRQSLSHSSRWDQLPRSPSPAEGRPQPPKAETRTLKWEGVTELHWPLLVGMEPVAVAPPALPRPVTMVPLDRAGCHLQRLNPGPGALSCLPLKGLELLHSGGWGRVIGGNCLKGFGKASKSQDVL